ncbi:TonB-dependent receptor [Oceanicoccus sp. KOV_DT_Chl]|uniref:TonB-dependent receptor n=1 Tax=Oceanicoccus sp. KOV_DT_Chl TaxID=1904639 RepID=UPI000C7D4CD7|nr:TonB-dependent receptor [Oceanicoccus sp. KOV_DT_Chl]
MHHRITALGLAITASALSGYVNAQESSPSSKFVIEEVIVTANKREEKLQEVPMSVSAFSGDFFKEAGASDFSSLEQYTPSLKIQPGADSRSTSIRIRGIGSVGSNSGIDPSVGIFIDGIYQGRAGMSISDLIDIERVEVLRGPQGTLYGKNTAAGAINITTKKPAPEFEAETEMVYDSDDRAELRGMVNVPLGANGNAMRMSAFGINGNHLYTNTYNGEPTNDANKWGVKSRFLFNLAASELLISVDYSNEDTDCCALAVLDYNGFSPTVIGVPMTRLKSEELQGIIPGFSFNALEDDPTQPGSPPLANPYDGKYWFNENIHNDVTVGGIAAEWNADLANDDGITFLNAWRQYTSNSGFDGDFSAYDAVAKSTTDVTLNQYSSELRITSPGGATLDYQGGLYAYYSDFESEGTLGMNYALLNNSGLLGALIPADDIAAAADVNDLVSRNFDTNDYQTTSFATFGQLTWNISAQMSTTLGLRVNYEKKERTGAQTTTPATSLDIAPIAGPDVEFDQMREDFDVSPSINLRYFWTDELMTYASVSRGFKSGGFDQRRVAITLIDADNDPSTPGILPNPIPVNGGNDNNGEFDEEIATNYELGWKGSWMDRRLTVNGTLYYVDYEDFQSQSFDGTGIKVTNAGSLESYGVELDVMFIAAENLSMGTAIGYNHAEYAEFDNGQCTIDKQIYTEVIEGSTVPCTTDLAGQPLDNAPEWTFSSFLQHDLAVGDDLMIVSRLEHNYIGGFFLDQDLDQNLYNEEVDLVNLRFTLTNTNRDWEIALWGKNILGEEYLAMGIDIPTVGGYAGVPAPDEKYGITLRYNFY